MIGNCLPLTEPRLSRETWEVKGGWRVLRRRPPPSGRRVSIVDRRVSGRFRAPFDLLGLEGADQLRGGQTPPDADSLSFNGDILAAIPENTLAIPRRRCPVPPTGGCCPGRMNVFASPLRRHRSISDGFGGIAAGASQIAQILFFIFLVLFIISLIAGGMRRPTV